MTGVGAVTSALFVGCGGGVSMRQFSTVYPGIAMDVVEPEPAVLALARACFGLADIPGLRVHLGEGAAFVADAGRAGLRWDVAIIDAYGAMELPGAIATPDSLARVAKLGLDARMLLANNDGYSFFAALDDLVVTGPTRTNVNDYRAILIL